MTQVWELSASETLAAFRARSLSPVEVMQGVLDRAETTETVVNEFSYRFFDEAMRDAKASEQRYGDPTGQCGPPGALDGLPVAVKDYTPIAGQPNSRGSLLHRDAIADVTSPVNQRLLDAGAIIHARSTCPEFAVGAFTQSRAWGITRNPWNPEFSPGGSSGGSAAALAAGSAMLATGTDYGGSIRIPASACGVVGFKPSYGRVPQLAPANLDTFSHEGPMARTASDCALLYDVLSGADPGDVTSIVTEEAAGAAAAGFEGFRVAVSYDLGGYRVAADVRRSIAQVAETLAAAGAVVEEVEVGWSRDDVATAGLQHMQVYGPIGGSYGKELLAQHRDQLSPHIVQSLEHRAQRPAGDPADVLGVQAMLYARMRELLTGHQVLLCPTMAVPAIPAGDYFCGKGPDIDGQPTRGLLDACLTLPFNLCSRHPVASVPAGLSPDGLPIGVQIVGRPYDDATVLQVACGMEALGLRWAPPVLDPATTIAESSRVHSTN